MYLLRLLNQPTYRIAGLSGMVILLWGITGWLRLLAAEVPPLELTGIALLGGALSTSLLPGTGRARLFAFRDHPWYAWIPITGGMIGGAVFYLAALSYAPAAQVIVINYSWPLLFAIASDVYSRRRPALLTFVSLLLGLAGVVVMNGPGQAPTPDVWLGYAGAIASGLCWVGYSLFVQVYSRPIAPAYPAFFTAGAVIALALQASTGGLVWPDSPSVWAACAVLGMGSYGIGFLAWGYVVQHGNPRIVPVLPYAVPAVAVITLMLVGQTQPTLSLLCGCALVVVACTTSTQVRAAP